PQTATAISIAVDTAMALLADGTVATWGGNDFGQLGAARPFRDPTPAIEPGLSHVKAVAVAGGLSLFALRRDGALLGWGANDLGALGDGTLIDRSRPVRAE